MRAALPVPARGPIPATVILLLRTGFSQRWPDAARYLGTAGRGADAARQLHFPGLHPDAARWLVDDRPVKAVGIDTASIDYGQSTRFETDRTLYARNIPGFENLTGLERLPLRGAAIVALPMKKSAVAAVRRCGRWRSCRRAARTVGGSA